MSAYSVARLTEIERMDDGRVPWRGVRHHFGITSFGINIFAGEAVGDRVLNEHDEGDVGQEELYFVQQGRARFELDGDSVDAPAGTFVFAEPKVKRTAFAEEPNTTVIAIGGTPGQAYEVSGWELWMPFQKLYADGRYEEAIAQARDTVEADTLYSVPLYNLACCESLAGRKDDAIEHLREAFRRSDRLRAFSKEDSDLDAIRDEPAYQELVGA